MSGFPKFASRFSSKLLLVCFFVMLLLVASCAGSNQPTSGPVPATPTPEGKKVTSAGVVNAQPQGSEISAGGSGEVIVRLVIQKGYHVNANPPTFPYLKATELEIKPAEGITVGKVSYPPAIKGKFAFAEEPLAVYEGETQLKAELKADKTAQTGSHSLSAVLRIQACDDEVCYPPGKIDLQIPVTIK